MRWAQDGTSSPAIAQDGISLNNIAAPGNNQIVGNYIGLQPDGTTPLGNGGDGIFMGNPGVVMNIIGPGNVISANSDGIQLDVGANNNRIIGNIIGLDAGGTIDLGNSRSGIQIGPAGAGSAVGNTIGGTTAADRNVISGNGDKRNPDSGWSSQQSDPRKLYWHKRRRDCRGT